jgi:hypothetical protein
MMRPDSLRAKGMNYLHNTIRPITVVIVGLMLLASCASSPGISTDISYCCRPIAESIYTYRVEFEDTPEFLKPMLRDSVSIVLDSKGLQYTEGEAHAILAMRYVDRTLTRQEETDIESWERVAPGGGIRFMAVVEMEMTDSVTGERIWAGSMQRVHNVYEGSYMHDEPAKAAMRVAFMEIFAGFPNPGLEQ